MTVVLYRNSKVVETFAYRNREFREEQLAKLTSSITKLANETRGN